MVWREGCRNQASVGFSHRPMRGAFLLGLMTVLSIYVFALSQPNASANMRPLLEFEWTVGVSFIVFLINLPLNLLVFSSLLLLVCMLWGRRAGHFPKAAMDFAGRVLLTVLLITALGVIIDFLFLYSYETTYLFEYDLLKWLAASAAVGLSVYALSLALLRMDIVLGAIPALAMMGLNLVSWWFTKATFESPFVVCLAAPSVIAGLLSIIPLVYLDRWHEKAFAHELADVK